MSTVIHTRWSVASEKSWSPGLTCAPRKASLVTTIPLIGARIQRDGVACLMPAMSAGERPSNSSFLIAAVFRSAVIS